MQELGYATHLSGKVREIEGLSHKIFLIAFFSSFSRSIHSFYSHRLYLNIIPSFLPAPVNDKWHLGYEI